MFRERMNHPVDKNHFGAGSIISENLQNKSYKKFIVVAVSDKHVQLMQNNVLVFNKVEVQDVNWLSRDEADGLFHQLNCTMTDLDIDNLGLKEIK